jgi:PadR family transcriptional regulator PadR
MIDREFQRGFIKLYALWRASKEETYGVQIIEEMRKLGFKVSPGTLYPVLHTLLKEKDLSLTDRVANGKVRKCYRATTKGREEAKEVIERLSDLLRKFR